MVRPSARRCAICLGSCSISGSADSLRSARQAVRCLWQPRIPPRQLAHPEAWQTHQARSGAANRRRRLLDPPLGYLPHPADAVDLRHRLHRISHATFRALHLEATRAHPAAALRAVDALPAAPLAGIHERIWSCGPRLR